MVVYIGNSATMALNWELKLFQITLFQGLGIDIGDIEDLVPGVLRAAMRAVLGNGEGAELAEAKPFYNKYLCTYRYKRIYIYIYIGVI